MPGLNHTVISCEIEPTGKQQLSEMPRYGQNDNKCKNRVAN